MRHALPTPPVDQYGLQLGRAGRHLCQVEHDRTSRRLVEAIDPGPNEFLAQRTVPDPELDRRPSRDEGIADRNDRDVHLVPVELGERTEGDLAW